MHMDRTTVAAVPATCNSTQDFDLWVEQHSEITAITAANFDAFANALSHEIDVDGFAVSAAYYASTGRDGLWVYERDGSFIPFCRHPANHEQILVFPPRGKKNFAAVTAFLNKAVAPANGFCLARFKAEDIGRLQMSFAFLQRVTFAPAIEKTMDWRFGVRVYPTTVFNGLAAIDGVSAEKFTSHHVDAVGRMIDPLTALSGKYRELLRLVLRPGAELKALVLSANGKASGALFWDIVNKANSKTATVHAALGDAALLPQLLRAAAQMLAERNVKLISFGGELAARIEQNNILPPAMIKLDLCTVRALLNDDEWAGFADQTPHSRVA